MVQITLRKGDGPNSSPSLEMVVRHLQYCLHRRGFDLEINGIFCSATQCDVKTFQKTNGIEATGIVDPLTWNALLPSLPQLTVKRGDGSSRSPWLQGQVAQLQLGLLEWGAKISVDGIFGGGTEGHVKTFQESKDVQANGIVGPETWAPLELFRRAAIARQLEDIAMQMPGFFGDLGWLHRLEGHNGSAYWPGGESGVTLDPGIDLGYAKEPFVRAVYTNMFNTDQWALLQSVMGLRGEDAKRALSASPDLKNVKVGREKAEQLFPNAAGPYWQAIVERFPVLSDRETIWSVQTVLLSLSYNRGFDRPALEVLAAPLATRDWAEVSRQVSMMQQDHRLEGIRKRRRWEGKLIAAELVSNQ